MFVLVQENHEKIAKCYTSPIFSSDYMTMQIFKVPNIYQKLIK